MKLPVTSRIVLFFVLLTAALLSAVGALSYRSGSASLRAAAISEMLATAVEKESALDYWIEERLNDMEQLAAETDLVEQAAQLVAAAPASEEARAAHSALQGELEPRVAGTRSSYFELFIMEPEGGQVLASTSPAEEGKAKRGLPYFDHGKTDLYLQAPSAPAERNASAMTAAIPLRASNGQVVAVLAARLSLAAMSTIAQRRTGLRRTDDSFLINAERFPITQPRFANEPVVLRRQFNTEAVRRCAERSSGVSLAADYRGVLSISVYRWNARRQMGLIVKIDEAEALAPARAFGRSVVLISSLALLAALGLALLLARTITRPLLTLNDRVRRFGKAELEERLVESPGDEVSLLASEFDRMAARVAARAAELAATHEAMRVENTERRRAEESLRASQQLLEGILNAMPVRVFWKDKNLIYLGCNAIFAHDAGFAEPKDIIGKDDFEMVWRDQAELYRRDDRQVIESGCPKVLIEEPRTTPEGKTITVLSTKLPLHGSSGEVSGVLGMYMDITERKRSEETLRLQSAALEATATGVAITDSKGTIHWVNPAFTELTGYSAAEAIGQNPRVLKSGRHPESFYRDLWQTISAGHVWKGEMVNRHKDGRLYQEEMTITPVRNQQGVVSHFVAIKQDITERKQAELEISRANQSLRESDEKFHQLADNISDTFWIRSPDMSEVHYVSPAFERIWGRSVKSLYAEPHRWVDFILPEDRERVRGAFAALVGEARSLDLEYRILRPDGEIRWVRARGFQVRDAADNLVRHAGIVTDITERKQAQEALRRTSELMLRTGELAKIGGWELDLQNMKLFWSVETGRIHEVDPPFAPSLDQAINFYAPEARPVIQAAVQAGIDAGKPFDLDLPLTTANGRRIWVRAQGSAVMENGKAVKLIGAIQDITERKRAQAELENLHKQLVVASRQAGMAEIATNVLHNVGNVLNSVNISTGLIVESVKKSKAAGLASVVVLLQEQAPDLGAFITHDTRGKHLPAYLAQLSEQLLAEQAANRGELDSLQRNVEHIKEIVAMQQTYASFGGVKEMINAVDLVEDSLRMSAGALSRHRVEVIRELETVPPMNVEKHKILQILVNLLRNAKYACQDSGRVDPRLTVRVANGDGRVRISVIDNGVGIPPENLTRIFIHGFTTRKNGHGFGLHSGALAAQEMGGSLTVHSDGLGQGAAFTLELPLPNPGQHP